MLLTGVAWLIIPAGMIIGGILSLALAGGCAVRALRVCPGVFGREAAILAACVVAMSVGVITYALATAWR